MEKGVYFVIASGITDDGRQRALLLHLIGPDTQEIFETLTDQGNTYGESMQALDTHFSVQKNIPFETSKFHQAKQHSQESIEQFITRLRKLSLHCEYDNKTDEQIRDQVIATCSSNKFCKRTY